MPKEEFAARADELLDEVLTARATGSPAAITSAEDAVVLHHLPIATQVARRFARRGAPLDDLEQQALLGLVQAVRRWEPGHAPSFLSYAVPTMEGSVKRWFRDRLTLVRRPRSLQEAGAVVRNSREELAHRNSHEPTPAEIAAHAGVSETTVRECAAADWMCNPDSLDNALQPDIMLGGEDHFLDLVESRHDLAHAMSKLTERERRVIGLRYWDDLSQAEVGAEVGVSQMQISRILRRALEKLSEDLAPAA
ncbi:sigma-70 family RNA polymerase sigma factor [Nakamurella alba]|nr:sigma-70 family RNA polymerase sigma factor [Nakamurella alba]